MLSRSAFVCVAFLSTNPTPAPAQSTQFEVASLKPAGQTGGPRPTRYRGGPGTDDPSSWMVENYSLAALIGDAFDKKFFEVIAPDWMSVSRFDIAARVPAGATKDQFRAMLRALLTERFHLAVGLEKRQLPGYTLKLAPNGSKLKESAPVVSQLPPSQDALKLGDDGYPVFPRGRGISMAIMEGRARYELRNERIAAFADKLGNQLRAHVDDQTGLTGAYDIELYWDARTIPPPDGLLGPDLLHAVREQLGLVLEQRKLPVEVIVVEHADRVPEAN